VRTRLTTTCLRNDDGDRPVFGNNRRLQDDPHFRDHVLYHEYLHRDTGRGVGASHQTGWTGLVAKLLQPRMKQGSASGEAEMTVEVGAQRRTLTSGLGEHLNAELTRVT